MDEPALHTPVHVRDEPARHALMVDGRIVRSGGPEVALALEEGGYAVWRDAEEKAGAI